LYSSEQEVMLRKEEQTAEDIEEQRLATLEKTLAELTVVVDRVVEFARKNGGLETEEATD